MSDTQNVSMEPHRVVTAAVNLLHVAFIKASRAQAKRHFARVQGGGVLDLAKLRLEDRSELLFRVALDHGQYRGRLSFTAFRLALPQLLGRLAERVRMKYVRGPEKPLRYWCSQSSETATEEGLVQRMVPSARTTSSPSTNSRMTP